MFAYETKDDPIMNRHRRGRHELVAVQRKVVKGKSQECTECECIRYPLTHLGLAAGSWTECKGKRRGDNGWGEWG